jgi:hypothetical protein
LKFQRTIACSFLLALLVVTARINLRAQSDSGSQDEEKGFTFYEQFTGSTNTLGQVMKADTSVGYNFNRYFGVDVGLPVYFVHASSKSSIAGAMSGNGIGNAYTDLRLTLLNPVVNYESTLTGWAPTGDTKKGFSTGRATFDWDNRFDRGFGRIRPFASVGVANTVPDSQFFVRPFTTLGTITHFEGGGTYRILRVFHVGASAYDILPTGQQKVFSKLIRSQTSGASSRHGAGVFENNHETVGSADLARDNGVSAWFDASPIRYLDLEVGYTRSVRYDLNTVSFGVGVNVGTLVKAARSL